MSLTELLVSLAAAGLVLGSTLTVLMEGQRAWAHGAARVEAQQSARIALVRMATELRQAGYGAAESEVPAVSVAEPTRLVIHFDLDGDRRVGANGETVTWRLDGRILRRNAGGGAQPIINGVAGLVLTYFDGANRPTTVASEVRAIAVTLTVEPAAVVADPSGRVAVRVATFVRLRNR